MYIEFTSQYGEDKWIYENISLPKEGTFVDIGADQPKLGSNTWFFENTLRWKGLLVDADPRVIKTLQENRQSKVIHSAVSDKDGEIDFELIDVAGISKIGKNTNSIKVPCKTLNSLFEENGIADIDLLDIDIEGHELIACNGLDWKKYKPYIVIIEFLSPLKDNYYEIKKYFESLPYNMVYRTKANLIYVRK